MVNKKLAQWIESEEAKGFNEPQLVKYLLNLGHTQKDIDEAVAYLTPRQHKSAFEILKIPILAFSILLVMNYAFSLIFHFDEGATIILNPIIIVLLFSIIIGKEVAKNGESAVDAFFLGALGVLMLCVINICFYFVSTFFGLYNELSSINAFLGLLFLFIVPVLAGGLISAVVRIFLKYQHPSVADMSTFKNANLKFNYRTLLKIPIWILVLFFPIMLFLGWSFELFLPSIYISLVLLVAIFLISYLDSINQGMWSAAVFIFSGILFFNINFGFFIIFMLACILAMTLFFRTHKQNNFFLLTVLFLIALISTLLVSFLLYLFDTYVVIGNLTSLNIIFIALIVLPIFYLAPILLYLLSALMYSSITQA